MKEHTWIIEWFQKCEELEIKPWEWDFKQSYIKEPIPKDKSSIELILDYKSRKLKEIGICNITKKLVAKLTVIKNLFIFINYFGVLKMSQSLNLSFL